MRGTFLELTVILKTFPVSDVIVCQNTKKMRNLCSCKVREESRTIQDWHETQIEIDVGLCSREKIVTELGKRSREMCYCPSAGRHVPGTGCRRSALWRGYILNISIRGSVCCSPVIKS